MSQSSNRATVEKMYEAMQTLEVGNLLEAFDPDVVAAEAESLPYGGIYKGLGEFGGLMAQVLSYVDPTSVRADAIVAEGDHVATMARITFRHPESGATLVMPFSEWFTFRDGKIVDARPFVWDTAALLAFLNTDPND